MRKFCMRKKRKQDDKFCMRKKRKQDDKIQLSQWSVSQLPFTKGTFASIFVNCQAVSLSLHAWFGVCSFFVHYPGDT